MPSTLHESERSCGYFTRAG